MWCCASTTIPVPDWASHRCSYRLYGQCLEHLNGKGFHCLMSELAKRALHPADPPRKCGKIDGSPPIQMAALCGGPFLSVCLYLPSHPAIGSTENILVIGKYPLLHQESHEFRQRKRFEGRWCFPNCLSAIRIVRDTEKPNGLKYLFCPRI